jgi:uncharacterized membrane protein
MTTPESCNEDAPATLSARARALLLISVALAGVLFGYGFMGMEDSNWIQIAVEVAVPALLLLSVGYALVESGHS